MITFEGEMYALGGELGVTLGMVFALRAPVDQIAGGDIAALARQLAPIFLAPRGVNVDAATPHFVDGFVSGLESVAPHLPPAPEPSTGEPVAG